MRPMGYSHHKHPNLTHISSSFHNFRCGHCKALAPAWAELGDAYAGSSSVLIGDVDCTEEEELCSKFEVRGFQVASCIVNVYLASSCWVH